MRGTDTVAKFGGTSLANPKQIRKVIRIIQGDPARKYIVVSAPGEREKGDKGITDLLLKLYNTPVTDREFSQTFDQIKERFHEITAGLKLNFDPTPCLKVIRKMGATSKTPDFVMSRGEELMARILAKALEPSGYKFVDAADIIKFNTVGEFDLEATKRQIHLLRGAKGYVIPGFYGSICDEKKTIKTFPRDGSDITGAIIARLVGTKIYEKWTRGVSGVLMADPKIVPEAKNIRQITYGQMRELSYSSETQVLHKDVIPILKSLEIQIHVRGTEEPGGEGTTIFPDTADLDRAPGLVGIAGRKDFTHLFTEKTLMNKELGFLRRLCGVFEKFRINIEQSPGGVDHQGMIAESDALLNQVDLVTAAIEKECAPDRITISPNLAIICTVWHDLMNVPGVEAALFGALAKEGINVRIINKDGRGTSIIVGVGNDDYERATRAIYDAFVK